MKREETYFEKGKGLASFSLLYPKEPGEVSNRQTPFCALSPATALHLGTDREHQKEIQSLFSRLPRDPDGQV
jgi:hypothetical protein